METNIFLGYRAEAAAGSLDSGLTDSENSDHPESTSRRLVEDAPSAIRIAGVARPRVGRISRSARGEPRRGNDLGDSPERDPRCEAMRAWAGGDTHDANRIATALDVAWKGHHVILEANLVEHRGDGRRSALPRFMAVVGP